MRDVSKPHTNTAAAVSFTFSTAFTGREGRWVVMKARRLSCLKACRLSRPKALSYPKNTPKPGGHGRVPRFCTKITITITLTIIITTINVTITTKPVAKTSSFILYVKKDTRYYVVQNFVYNDLISKK